MKISRSLCSSLLVLFLTGPALAADFDPKGDLATQAKDFVTVDNPEYLSGVKRVVITAFAVDFVSELKYSKAISGLQALMGADSNVAIKLTGHQPEQFQAMTDRFYDQTVAHLKSAGIEVVDREILAALPEFGELQAKGITPLPSEQDAKTGKGMFYSAYKLPLLLSDEAQFISKFHGPFSKPKEDLFLTFGTRFSGGFSAGMAQMQEDAIAKKLDATLLKVRLTVMGSQLTPDNSFWSSGKVSTRAAATFVDFVNRYHFITPDGKRARIALKDNITTGEIGELVNVTSSADKASDTVQNTAMVALNVLSFAARMQGVAAPMGGSYSATTNFECRVEHEPFARTVSEYHDALSKMFAGQLGGVTLAAQ